MSTDFSVSFSCVTLYCSGVKMDLRLLVEACGALILLMSGSLVNQLD